MMKNWQQSYRTKGRSNSSNLNFMRLFILPSTHLQIKNDDYDEFFTAPKGKNTAEITTLWKEPVCLGNIVIKENIYADSVSKHLRLRLKQTEIIAKYTAEPLSDING